MDIERRKEERIVTCNISNGELYHPGTGQYFVLESVYNLSSNGIRLQANVSLQQGEQVSLGFKHGRIHHQMTGHVVWCKPAEDEPQCSFLMGVQLS